MSGIVVSADRLWRFQKPPPFAVKSVAEFRRSSAAASSAEDGERSFSSDTLK
jgi:hypothetical protein